MQEAKLLLFEVSYQIVDEWIKKGAFNAVGR